MAYSRPHSPIFIRLASDAMKASRMTFAMFDTSSGSASHPAPLFSTHSAVSLSLSTLDDRFGREQIGDQLTGDGIPRKAFLDR